MTTVYIVHISHRHGSGSEAFSTREKAYAYLASWAREWWHEIARNPEDQPPADDDECISQYFTEQDNECFDFDEVQLDRCVPKVDA
jgi:hypothetical protein